MGGTLTTVNTPRTPQSVRADARQVPNAAGGVSWEMLPDVAPRTCATSG
jgi:hypothetical protein